MSDFKHEQARLNKDELKMAVNASKKRQHSMRRKQPTIIDFLSNPAMIMSSASEQMSYVARRRSTRRRTGLVVPEYHEEDEQQKAPLKVKPTLATITETNNELGQDPSSGGVGESTKQPLFLDGAAAVTTEQKDNGELDLNNLTNLADFAADPEPAPAAVAPSAQPAVASNYAPVPMEPEANEVVNLATGGSGRVASPELMQLRSTSSDAPPPIGFVKGDFEPEDVAADLTVSNKEKMESARRYTSYKLNRLVPLTASQVSSAIIISGVISRLGIPGFQFLGDDLRVLQSHSLFRDRSSSDHVDCPVHGSVGAELPGLRHLLWMEGKTLFH